MKLIRPMLATPTIKPFNKKDWIFEVKWDGYRTIAILEKEETRLWSRNLHLLNDQFRPLVNSLEKLKINAVIDGEIVVLNEKGTPDFNLLQNYHKDKKGFLKYYVFDLLNYENKELYNLPLFERRKFLKQIIPENPLIGLSESVEERGINFFEKAKELGFEGVVAKQKYSKYYPGQRTRDWLKIPAQNFYDAVIGGFTEPSAKGQYFGALLIGAYEEDALIYKGKVGTGFNELDAKKLYDILIKIKSSNSHFSNLSDSKKTQWVKPLLVCRIKLREWTKDGIARQPVFLGIRNDIEPKDVKIEKTEKKSG